MCGIYGWQFKPGAVSREQRAVLSALLSLGNDSRGGESWGYWDGRQVRKGLKTILQQSALLANTDLLMAHTRKATTGKVEVENSHPYQVGHILGAHNGMVYNHDALLKKYERKFPVDSMHLFAHIAEGKSFDEVEGYGAIEYVDNTKPGHVFLCKMKGGELAVYGIGKGRGKVRGVVWSSSERQLKEALSATGLEVFPYEVEEAQQYFIREGALYVGKTMPKLELSKATRSFYGSTDQYGHYSSGWNGWESGKGSAGSTGNNKVLGRNAKSKDSEDVQAVNVARMSEAMERRLLNGKLPTPEQFTSWGHDMRQAMCLALDNASSEMSDDDSGACFLLLDRNHAADVAAA